MNRNFQNIFNSQIDKRSHTLAIESEVLNTEFQNDIDKIGQVQPMITEAIEDLSNILKLKNILKSGKVSSTAMEQTSLLMQNVCQRQGMVYRPRYFALENIDNPNYALEGVADFIKSVWEAIVKAIQRVIEWVGNMFTGGSSGGSGGGSFTKVIEKNSEIIENNIEIIKKSKIKKMKNGLESSQHLQNYNRFLNTMAVDKDMIKSLGVFSERLDKVTDGCKHYNSQFEGAGFEGEVMPKLDPEDYKDVEKFISMRKDAEERHKAQGFEYIEKFFGPVKKVDSDSVSFSCGRPTSVITMTAKIENKRGLPVVKNSASHSSETTTFKANATLEDMEKFIDDDRAIDVIKSLNDDSDKRKEAFTASFKAYKKDLQKIQTSLDKHIKNVNEEFDSDIQKNFSLNNLEAMVPLMHSLTLVNSNVATECVKFSNCVKGASLLYVKLRV